MTIIHPICIFWLISPKKRPRSRLTDNHHDHVYQTERRSRLIYNRKQAFHTYDAVEPPFGNSSKQTSFSQQMLFSSLQPKRLIACRSYVRRAHPNWIEDAISR